MSSTRTARAYLADRGVPAQRLVYFGESLGAAVATRLATEQPPGGLVLRSPFTCLAAVGSRHYPLLPVRLLLRAAQCGRSTWPGRITTTPRC